MRKARRKTSATLVIARLIGTMTCFAFLCQSGMALAADVNVSTGCGLAEESPGFRTFMPDCRAYELVSPVYGGGQPAFGTGHRAPTISADGQHVIADVFAGFAGTENLEQSSFEYGAVYKFSRTSSAWSAEALDPPASQYPRREFVFTSADTGRSAWLLAPAKHPGEDLGPTELHYTGWTLAVRDPIGNGKGRFTPIGGVVAPEHESPNPERVGFHVVGASADLSHIFLKVVAERQQTWPGDETVEGDESLYEYVGSGGGAPTLVGRDSSGSLISQCGTNYDAVSANGAVVDFTALHDDGCGGTQPTVNEIYARVNGITTTAVSEPSAGDCELCDTSSPESALFESASEDGAKIFFRSKQALLPGATGETLYEYDRNGPAGQRVTLIAPNVDSVAATATTGARIYLVSSDVLTPEGNANGETAEAGEPNLYVYDTQTDQTRFVARQAQGTFETNRDGSYLVFSSSRHLLGTNDVSGSLQLFEYNAGDQSVARVSAGQKLASTSFECPLTHVLEAGFNCDGNTVSEAETPRISIPAGFAHATGAITGLAVAQNGMVAFSSPRALTPQAVQGRVFLTTGGFPLATTENVYEYAAGNTYLISPADEEAPVRLPSGDPRLLGIGESGRDILFFKTDSLVPQDTDTQSSWYDAREGGGFPAPASKPDCAGESCLGPANATPALAAPQSVTASEGGELYPPVAKASVPSTRAQKPLTRAQHLTKALSACRRGPRGKRHQCEAQARRKYGAVRAKKHGRGTK